MNEKDRITALESTRSDGEVAAADAAADASSTRSWDKPWLILVLLFGVTLFLGFPILWASRRFSKPMKWLITVAVLAHTVLVFWLFWLVMVWCYERISGALSTPI